MIAFRRLARAACLSFLLPAALPAANAPNAPPPAVAADRIVAVVNDDVITLNELAARKAQIVKNLQRQGTPLPPDEVLNRQVLERMIIDLVQVQLAKEGGIRVDDVQLDRTMQRIAEDNKMNLTQFRAALEKDGLDYATFREDIRSEIVTSRLREREVDSAISVTDSEIEAELTAQRSRAASETEYRLQHILVLVPDQATPQQIAAKQKRAEEAAARLAGGADFAQVAASYSEAADALSGGNLGWRASARMPTLFVEAIGKLKDGEVGPILRSPNGFHIIKVNERRGKAGGELVTQARARHILLKPRDGVSDAELRQRLEVLKARVEAGTDFAELAKLQSDDSSGVRGGDLGWLSPGETVPEFERAMNELQPGQISAPVQSPFGWHLIQVLERRQAALPEDKQKLAVRQTIRARKGDEAYQEWLRQIRDRAFVENRLEDK